METTVAATIFAITYAAIISERVNRTAAALIGATVMIMAGVLDQEQAFAAIDLNVVFLLAGMMMIVAVVSRTGVFEWIGMRVLEMAGGRPLRAMLLLSLATAAASAVLDNVTTMVLIAPVVMAIAARMGISAVPLLISQALASNIGGVATLVGDPPNILIGSAAGLNFVDFLVNLAPVVLLILVAYAACLAWIFPSQRQAGATANSTSPETLEAATIQDPRLLAISGGVLALVIVGFLLHGPLGYEPATVALLGAAALMLVSKEEAQALLLEVEWSTLFFFIGLFIVVGGLEQVGVLSDIGGRFTDIAGGQPLPSAMLILWMSGLASGIVDNIPYTAAMIPVVQEMNADLHGGGDVLWWALALGAGLGGNLTIVGASANILAANLAGRAGRPISFWEFFRYGAPVTLASMAIASAYLWLRYLL